MPAKKIVKKVAVKKVTKAIKPTVKKVVAKKILVKVAAKKAETVPTSLKFRGAGKVEAKIAVSKPTKSVSMNASVFDTKGKVTGHMELPSEIFGAKINDSLMSQAVRVYLANQRQGTSKTQDRGEVDRTTKKIYQQKGTGRARHGSRRAPIFVGGGRVFGPTPRDLSLSISKKMKILALFSALSSKLKDSEIKIIQGLETIEPKTKLMAEVLKNLEIKDASKILLVMSKPGKEAENVYRAGRNIKGVEIVSANSLNAYRVLDNKMIILMKEAVGGLKDTFIKK
jgi:large subunit ribosomal protein L4